MKCPKCGKNIPDDSKFCLECGSNISSMSHQSGLEKDVSLGDMQTVAGRRLPSSYEDMVNNHSLAERYEIKEEIGRGGFAVVYKAQDRKLGRWVAIKRLLKTADTVGSHTLERFRREARVVAGLNHRNVVAVFDVGDDADGIYLVMEYVEGGNLRDFLKKKKKLSLPEAIPLMKGIVQGLSYAHRKNLVHRDIKPANILMAEEGGELVPKIVDFGLAQAGRDSELSMSGYGMGTPYYMPPEQRRNAKNVNHTADIYALGKVLYEMVTGEIPDNVDPEVIPPPKALSSIVFRCIKSKPEERYFSVEELWQELEQLGGKVRGLGTRAGALVSSENGCPSCGAENPKDTIFCEQCGTGLYRECPECGREDRAYKQFCGACGTDVEGFANALDAMQRMEEYAADKKWTRVVKEYELLSAELRLPGDRGKVLLADLQKRVAGAEGMIDRRTAISERILAAKEADDRLEEALALVGDYQNIDPHNAEINELPGVLEQRIDERDYARANTAAEEAENKGTFDTAAECLSGYLEQHSLGLFADKVRCELAEGLPSRRDESGYRSCKAEADQAIQEADFPAAITAYEAYFQSYPEGRFVSEARRSIDVDIPALIDAADFQQVDEAANQIEVGQQFEAMIELYQGYLEEHPSGGFAATASSHLAEISVRIADRDYEQLYSGVQEIKYSVQNSALSLGKNERKLKEMLQHLDAYIDKYPGYRNIEILQFERDEVQELYKQVSDELAFEKTSSIAKTLIQSHQYSEVSTLYKEYLLEYSIHRGEAEKILQITIPRLIDEKQQRVKRARWRVGIGALVATLVLVLFSVFIGIEVHNRNSAKKDFERAEKEKDASAIRSLAVQLKGKYPTQPVLANLEEYEAKRNDYLNIVGNNESRLEGFSGDDADDLRKLLDKVDEPEGLERGIGLYSEIISLVEKLHGRSEELKEKLKEYDRAVGEISEEDYEAYVPILWEEVKAQRNLVKESAKSEDKIQVLDRAIVLAKSAQEQCDKKLGEEERKKTDLMEQYGDILKQFSDNLCIKYNKEELRTKAVAAGECAGKAKGLQDSIAKWGTAVEVANNLKRAVNQLKEGGMAETEMSQTKTSLLSDLVNLAETRRQIGLRKKETPTLLVEEMAELYPTSGWDPIVNQIKKAEELDKEKDYSSANVAYSKAVDMLAETPLEKLALSPEKLYRNYIRKAQNAYTRNQSLKAYLALFAAKDTEYDDPLENLEYLSEDIDKKFPFMKKYASMVYYFGEDLRKEVSSDYDNFLKDNRVKTNGDKENLMFLACRHLQKNGVLIYYRAAQDAEKRDDRTACQIYFERSRRFAGYAQKKDWAAMEALHNRMSGGKDRR